MIRTVLDTNVVVSALLNPDGAEASIVQLVLEGLVQLCVSDAVVAEYEGVLHRPKFVRVAQFVTAHLAALRAAGERVDPKVLVDVSKDDADNRFLECAEAAQADNLVTGNKRHFPPAWRETRVVTARQFLELVHPQ